MLLSAQQIAEFTNLYRNEFGVELSVAEAQEAGTAILRIVGAVYGAFENENENAICRHS